MRLRLSRSATCPLPPAARRIAAAVLLFYTLKGIAWLAVGGLLAAGILGGGE